MSTAYLNDALPVINIAPLLDSASSDGQLAQVARELGEACREVGFFYITGHHISATLEDQLERVARDFFARSEAEKSLINMSRGGRAWRGWFKLGSELTSGLPDQKEGIYFGDELSSEHPEVMRGTPLHGPNLFADDEMRAVVLSWMSEMSRVGHALMRGIALSLGLEADRFDHHGMSAPLPLFRIFHYPTPTTLDLSTDPSPDPSTERWGVGEHTDYGVLTILKQDQNAGLQVKVKRSSEVKWIDAPPLEGTFVINIGDMLEKMTRGLYVSTPHRVRNTSGRSRYSFPFFFDPHFHAEMSALEGISPALTSSGRPRWDGEDVHRVSGTYGAYLMKKVGRVFPSLSSEVDLSGEASVD